MITFKQFVKSLGPRASEHTPDQLRQFHVQTQKLVDILLGLRRDVILPFRKEPISVKETSSNTILDLKFVSQDIEH